MCLNLYYKNWKGDYHLVIENVDEKQVFTKIDEYLADHNIKSYYKRCWEVKEGLKIDFGSHSEFFLWGVI